MSDPVSAANILEQRMGKLSESFDRVSVELARSKRLIHWLWYITAVLVIVIVALAFLGWRLSITASNAHQNRIARVATCLSSNKQKSIELHTLVNQGQLNINNDKRLIAQHVLPASDLALAVRQTNAELRVYAINVYAPRNCTTGLVRPNQHAPTVHS